MSEELKTKSCPFSFSNVNIQNIILILLTIKTIWNAFKENAPEEIILNRLNEQVFNIPNHFNIPMSVPPPPITGSNFCVTKMILLGVFIYIMFFIRDVIDSFREETKVCDTNMRKCPFKFCGQ